MLKEYSNTYRQYFVLIDVLTLMVAFFLGYYLRYQINPIYSLHFYAVILPLFIGSWIVFLWWFGVYNSFRLKKLNEMIFEIVKAMVCGFLTLAAVMYLLKIQSVSRLLLLFIYVLSFSLLSLKTVFLLAFMQQMRKKGHNFRNVLLVGTGRRARHFLKQVRKHPEWGINVLGPIDPKESGRNRIIEGHRVMGTIKDAKEIVHSQAVDGVICFIPAKWLKDIEPLVGLCEVEGININVAVDLYDLKFFRPRVVNFVGFPLVSYQRHFRPTFWLGVKRIFDVFISSLILLLTLPFFLVIAILIKSTSRGPVFFKQERYGLNGRIFMLYKFRTMVENAADLLDQLKEKNEMEGPVFKIKDDPRLTPIGSFLRKYSIDEFPQFWNILKGDMSIVGPRPPIVKEVGEYDDWHRRRLRDVRPGLTCLWQVSGRNKISDFNQWVRMDLDYIDNWSFWLDLKIFLKTIPVVLTGHGAK